MKRILQTSLLPVSLAIMITGSGGASAQPPAGQTAQSDKVARCAVEKHPNEARWLKALMSKEVSFEPEVRGGAVLNALGPILRDCLLTQEQPHFDIEGFFTTLRRIGGSAGPAPAGSMDELGSCFVRFAPEQATAFLRESDLEASRSFTGTKMSMGSVSDTALEALISKSLSKSPGCGPTFKKLGKRVQHVDANALYSRLNWLLRVEPQLGAGKR